MEIGIIEFSPVAQFAITRNHKVVRWNRACELLTGRSAEQIVGTDRHWEAFYQKKRPLLADLVVEHDRRGMSKLYGKDKVARSRVIPHAWETETYFEDVGGQPRYLHFLAAPIYDDAGDISGAVETFLDITEQKNYEKALKQSEEGYRVLAENIPDGFALMQEGKFLLVNQAFASIFGFESPDQLIGKRSSLSIASSHKVLFEKTLLDIESGRSRERVLRWPAVTEDGREIWVEGHPNVMKWENKPAVLTTVIDITEIRAKDIAIREESNRLRKENIQLRSSIKDRFRFGKIVGKSPAMQVIYDLILKAASSHANVIIYGESGTGKELVARAVHQMSDRQDRAFVTVNCGAIPETLLESEFFGYKKGAFTGAQRDKSGFLDRAHGGTLFLDEVGELSLNLQAKLLRALEEGGYTPVGGTRLQHSDFRMIAATNKDLKEHVQKGMMRNDFFYRIHVIPIHLPPLRDRIEDIPLLVDNFLQAHEKGKELNALPGKVMEALYKYSWPGNVRELQNALHHYLTVGRVDFIHAEDSAVAFHDEGVAGQQQEIRDIRSAVENLERQMIRKALIQTSWNKTRAATLLGLPRKTLFRKMKKYGDFRP